jgi:hypothetical protein
MGSVLRGTQECRRKMGFKSVKKSIVFKKLKHN